MVKKNRIKKARKVGARRQKLMRFATYASVLVAFSLILAKVVAFVLTGSMAMLATVVDSCLDLLASLVNMFSVRQATLPADRNHRFGHGKFEPLAGIGQSTFVFGSGLFLMVASLGKLGKGYEVDHIEVGVGVMLFSIVMTGFLVFVQAYVVKKTKSVAIAADKAHYTGDLMINFSVIVSLLVVKYFNFYYADIAFAILIAVYLMHTALAIFKDSLMMLTDAEMPDEDRAKIVDVILKTKGVKGVHDVRTRSSGDKLFVQCHLEIDAQLPLAKAHQIGDNAEDAIMKLFPNAEVLVHHDPYGLKEEHPELWYDLGVELKEENKAKAGK